MPAHVKVSAPGDRHEREADHLAAGVVRGDAAVREHVRSLTPRTASTPSAGGRPLDDNTRSFMEERFGTSFANVRVHTGGDASDAALSMHARAFTLGRDITFAAGQYRPSSAEGRSLLAHELAHVVQQQAPGGPASVVQRQLYPPVPIIINPQLRCYWRRRANGTATPNTGINVTWAGNHIDIRARVQFSGPGSTGPIADAMRRDIESRWTLAASGGYSSTCQLDVQVGGATDSTRAQIIVGTGGSVTDSSTTGSTMYFMYDGPNALIWSPAHEFGHLLGLRDRRTRPMWDFFGLSQETSERGYERNMMGAIPGGDYARRTELRVEARNIRDWLDQYATERVCGPPPTA